MKNVKHWAESLKTGDKCKGTIRHPSDGAKNRINIDLTVVTNCKEFGFNSIIAKDSEGFTFRVPYNELIIKT
ncbi:hypothetical protein [Chryseobacterium sp.]|uniref:hypothetical protein n=1 Tax=Chryseobacterium sp. TaxID=1871047 RepID=UPI0024E2600E|nr:hypothetical protein [Chryseobacterium sp.]